jgi:hypothetical protein
MMAITKIMGICAPLYRGAVSSGLGTVAFVRVLGIFGHEPDDDGNDNNQRD